MALKDWKKERTINKKDLSLVHWSKTNGKRVDLFVSKQDYAPEVWGKKPSEWTVELDKGNYPITLRRFKTKSEALKYARNYMRKH